MTHIKGQTITDVRDMTDKEYDKLGWIPDNLGRATVLVLENGIRVFAACDPEGNNAGFLNGAHRDQDELLGAVIVDIFPMNKNAVREREWTVNAHRPAPPVLALDNERPIYPLRDGEANGPGALYYIDPETNETCVITFKPKEPTETNLFDSEPKRR